MTSSPNPLLPGEKGAIIHIYNGLSPSLPGEGFGERPYVGVAGQR
jgi:hypothetical protein